MKLSSKNIKAPYIAIDATALFRPRKTGVEWYSWQLFTFLAKEWKTTDPDVVLFTNKQPEKKLGFKNPKWRFKYIPGKYFWTQYHLLNFLKHFPPKLFFSPSYVRPVFLPKSIPSVSVVHGLEGEHFPEFITLKQIILEYLLTIPALKKTSKLVSVSEHTKNDLNYFYNIPLSKITTVLSGPGTVVSRSDNNLKNKNDSDIKLLFLGGNQARKNTELAIRIFSQLKKYFSGQDKKISLQISGKIINQKTKRIVDKRKDIIQLGYIPESKKTRLLESADFLLYPSLYEGFGFPVLEAQTCGTVPVVLKDSGLEEIGGDGLIEYNPNNEKESISIIASCINKADKYREIQMAGLKNVRRFSWESCAQEIREILINTIK